ncbi:MAG: NUDIX domain-containing protein, partial [Casimicrobium sp.]
FEAGTVSSVPSAKPKAKVKIVRAVALLVHFGDRVLLVPRPKNGLLGGLYGVPLLELQQDQQIALDQLLSTHKLTPPATHLGAVAHTMTHRQFEIEVYAVENEHAGLEIPSNRALSNLDRKILALLEKPRVWNQSSLFSAHKSADSG